MPRKTRDLGASVRARLLRHAQQKAQVFDLVLTQFAIERALYRLSLTRHAERFVLKGAMQPGIEMIDYPAILDLPAPRLRAYARETVIAEKFQAMVMLGRANSRMKDIYDIWLLNRSFSFDDDRLARAIAATFERRGTSIPSDAPDALTPAFAADELKQRQWRAFVTEVALDPGPLSDVVAELATFLLPRAARAIELAQK